MSLAALPPKGAGAMDRANHHQLRQCRAAGRPGPRSTGPPRWGRALTPVTTAAGRPLPLADQRSRSAPYQPLPDGLRLATMKLSHHEWRFPLIDRAGRVVRARRVTSQT